MPIILFVVGFFLAAGCNAQKRLPNARYLGMGYNAITGNPDNDLNDPGFAFSVLDFTWKAGMTTSDGKYLVPDHVQALQTRSCGFQSEATTQFGSRSYQNALSVDVSVEAESGFGLWSARFTASAGYRKVNEGTSQYHRVYTSASSKCIQYQLSVNYLHTPISVTSNFAQAVSSLPLQRNDKAYNTFINIYGTHFTSRVTMGAKMVVLSEFDEHALTRMEEQQLNVETGAKLSFLRSAAGITGETDVETQQRQTFESLRTSYSASYLGSHPPSNGEWETWAESSGNSPYPVKYKLAPLTSLLTSKYFANMSAHDLSTRRTLLSAAYDIYCQGLSGCGTPPPDRTPVRMKKSVSRFTGLARVSCPPAYNLLSCGILNHQTSGGHDKQRYAIPANSRACQCFDRKQANCVSWCTNTAVQYRIAKSSLVRGETTVSCPAGYKVLGCHAKHDSDKEKWTRNYPLDDGNRCRCYNHFGVTCIASCASNMRFHEVRHQFGFKTIKVSCSAGNFVLGCGIRPKFPADGFEKWRSWAVKSLDSCECYDFYGATCYAICGQLT